MADLEFTGGFDISEALDSVDDLATEARASLEGAFERSVDAFGDSASSVIDDIADGLAGAAQDAISVLDDADPVVDVTLSADASAIPAAAEASVADVEAVVPIEADTAPAEAAVSDLIEEVEANAAQITVEADTGGSEADVDSLNDSLVETSQSGAQASSALDTTASSATILGGVGAVASGQLGGVVRVFNGMGPAGAKAAGAFGGVAAAAGILISQGIGAIATAQRFEAVVGDMADELDRVEVGSLRRDLDDLAISLGSDDEALREASASLFQFGLNSGTSRGEAAEFTEQIDALAARAVALDPRLGSVGGTAEQLGTRIARGGRATEAFGLSLSVAEIQTRALANTGKEAAEDLTIFERAQAAAQIAVERYGGSLERVVTKGSENAIITQRRLREEINNVLETAGQPLVVPAFEVLEAGTPIVEELAETVSDLAVAALPALETALDILVPPLRIVSAIVQGIPDPIIAGATAVILFRTVLGSLPALLQRAGTSTATWVAETRAAPAALGAAGAATNRFGGFLDANAGRLAAAAGASLVAASAFDEMGESAGGTTLGIGAMTVAGGQLGAVVGAPGLGAALGFSAGAAVSLGRALLDGGESADEMRGRIRGLAEELDGLGDRASARTFVDEVSGGVEDLSRDLDLAAGRIRGSGLQVGTAIRGAGENVDKLRRDFGALARESPGHARIVLAGLQDLRRENGKPLLPPEVITQLERSLARGSAAYAKAALDARRAAASNDEIIQKAGEAGNAVELSAEQQKQALADAQGAWDAYVSHLRSGVPSIEGTFGDAVKATQNFADESETALDPKVLVDKLAEHQHNVEEFTINVSSLIAREAPNLAKEVAKLGPEEGAAVAAALREATPEVLRALEDQVTRSQFALDALSNYIGGPLAETLQQKGMIAGVSAGASIVDGSVKSLQSGKKEIIDTALQTARSVDEEYEERMRRAGRDGGRALNEGTASAFEDNDDVIEAARRSARELERAVKEELGISSPSRVFAEIGRDLMLGWARGIDDNVDAPQRAMERAAALRPALSLAGLEPFVPPSVQAPVSVTVPRFPASFAGLTATHDDHSVHFTVDKIVAAPQEQPVEAAIRELRAQQWLNSF